MRMFRLLVLSVFPVFLLAGCTKKQPKEPVVLYSSQDQIYAEPILKEFTRKTGIEIKPLFDSESAKTVGLAHRLRAERSYP